MKPLPRSIVDELNEEYAVAMFSDGQVCVIWRDRTTGEIRKRPTGIAFRYAPLGFGPRLQARWLADPRRRELDLDAGTRIISDEEWGPLMNNARVTLAQALRIVHPEFSRVDAVRVANLVIDRALDGDMSDAKQMLRMLGNILSANEEAKWKNQQQ